jgi:hypothetical protein
LVGSRGAGMKRLFFILFIVAIFFSSCVEEPDPEYYRITIINQAGNIIYDESGPWHRVNIQTKILQNNPFEVITVYSTKYPPSFFDSNYPTIYEVAGHNLQVIRKREYKQE